MEGKMENTFKVGDKLILSEDGKRRNSITKNTDSHGEIISLPKNGYQVILTWPGYKSKVTRPYTDFILYAHAEEKESKTIEPDGDITNNN